MTDKEEVKQEEKKEEKDDETLEDDPVVRAEKAAEAMRIENDRMEKNLARAALGGKTLAGEQPEEKKEETPLEYAQRMIGGGGTANEDTKGLGAETGNKG